MKNSVGDVPDPYKQFRSDPSHLNQGIQQQKYVTTRVLKVVINVAE